MEELCSYANYFVWLLFRCERFMEDLCSYANCLFVWLLFRCERHVHSFGLLVCGYSNTDKTHS